MGRTLVCSRCGTFGPHHARMLCHYCYNIARRSGELEEYPTRFEEQLRAADPRRWWCSRCNQWSFATFATELETRYWRNRHRELCA